MKGILVFLMSIVGVISLFGTVNDPSSASHDLRQDEWGRMIINADQIAGSWHSFPVGLIVQFNDDGRAYLGLDNHGKVIGYEAEIWLTGKNLAIKFTNFDGEDEQCQIGTGLYEVQLGGEGGIKFIPIYDDCQFRMDVLNGFDKLGYELVYQPVK